MSALATVFQVVVASGLPLILTYFLVASTLEYIRPIQPVPFRKKAVAIWFLSFAVVAAHLGRTVLTVVVVALVNAAGAGLFDLPTEGYGLIASCILFILAADCLKYWRHRLEHAVPALWVLHSFHHSDRSLNVFSAHYTYWLSKVAQSAIELPILGLLFKVPLDVLAIWAAIQTLAAVTMHLNLRIGWGPLTLMFVGPQFHRIHHSLDPRHQDRNFAHVFPIWDILFGTAWKPTRDEWPDTGIDSEPSAELTEVVTWPTRFMKRRSASQYL